MLIFFGNLKTYIMIIVYYKPGLQTKDCFYRPIVKAIFQNIKKIKKTRDNSFYIQGVSPVIISQKLKNATKNAFLK